MVDRERLHALLGGDDLAWLRSRVRHRVEQGATVGGTVRLRNPSPAQREAADRLMGRPPSRGAQVSVSLDMVDRMLRDALVCDGLTTAVEALDGPIADRGAQRRATTAAWAQVLVDAGDAVDELDADATWARDWLDELTSTGLLRRLADGPTAAAALLDQAVAVLAALPAADVTTAGLAARVLGDSHALDDGRPLATLVLKGIQHRSDTMDRGRLPTGDERRALWASAGVVGDELSSTVLALGLRGGPDGAAAAPSLTAVTLSAHARATEPIRLTLSQLTRHPVDFGALAGTAVFVCENPSIVAAASRRAATECAPLVCVEGQPSAAAQLLLRQLATADARLAYHGDFDWPGLRIGTLLMDRFGAAPWRFATHDYLAAPAGPPLLGPPATASWDPDLADTMAARGVAVHEEQVLDELLADLSVGG